MAELITVQQWPRSILRVFKYSHVCANLEASNQRSAVPVRWPAPYFVWSLIYCFAQLWCMR